MEQLLLYILLIMTLLAVAGLALALYRCRRRLGRCQEAMVRLINENLEMKEKLPAHERPNFMNRGDITPEEFTEIIHNMLKRLMFLSLFFLVAVYPSAAQEKTDTTYLFRFVPEKDMFYVPWNGNDKELARLENRVAQYRKEILDGKIPLRVDGYCNSLQSRKENLNVAYIRANRVKSELITRSGLVEKCFITRNHASDGDFVTVRLEVPLMVASTVNEPEEQKEVGIPEQQEEQMANHETVSVRDTTTAPSSDSSETPGTPISETLQETSKEHILALRANLLRWATLTPDLGIEWRINRSWSIMVNGSWTSWSWKDKDRRYALWEVAPEIRYHIGGKKAWYVGAMFKTGEFNYKLSETGKQGDLMGGGITGGYQLRLNNALSLDLNLGIGCVHADYEKYGVIDGVRVRQGKESKNWWGPVSAGLTLVWTIF